MEIQGIIARLTWLVIVLNNMADSLQLSKSLLLRQALETVILPGIYPKCHNVDFKSESITCQIQNSTDERHLVCLGHQECTGHPQIRVQSCPDGSHTKTCIKAPTTGEYVCACQSSPRASYRRVEHFSWTSDWDPTVPDIEHGNVFHRRLCHGDDWEAECVAEEKIHFHYLVAHLDVSDDVISTSSYWNFLDNHAPKRVRLGRYTDPCCGWAASGWDSTPWVKFDMGSPVTVWGLLLKERCDYLSKVLSCDVTFSHDGDAWKTAAKNLVAPYPDGSTLVVWLQQPIRGRYWRIHPLTWVNAPTMKADLIGRMEL